MGGLLSAVGQKIADRWIALLLLPGAAFFGAAVAARVLGAGHALSIGRLASQTTAWARQPVGHGVGGQAILLAGVLLASSAAGLVAGWCGVVLEKVVLASDWHSWPIPGLARLADSQVDRRRSAWDLRHVAYHQHLRQARTALTAGVPQDPAVARRLYAARNRIALEKPVRPTWSGDRILAAATRVDRDLAIDLVAVWPAVWLTLSEAQRTEITAARDRMRKAAVCGGWALMYSALAAVTGWWPAWALAIGSALWGRVSFRAAVGEYALLLETSTRLTVLSLAQAAKLVTDEPFDRTVGDALTRRFRSEPAPPVPFIPDPAAGTD